MIERNPPVVAAAPRFMTHSNGLIYLGQDGDYDLYCRLEEPRAHDKLIVRHGSTPHEFNAMWADAEVEGGPFLKAQELYRAWQLGLEAPEE